MCSDRAVQTYIIASNKRWHFDSFCQLRDSCPGHWMWVENTAGLEQALESADVRFIFFLHWSERVPQSIWSNYECVCFHMTDLPFGRGGSPLQNLILRGHTETKLSAFRMVEAMDAGPVYMKRVLPLEGRAQDIYLRAGQLSFEMIRLITESEPVPVEQQGPPLLFKRRTPEQSQIPEGLNEQQRYDFIRMLDADGYPHAYIEQSGMRVEFRDAEMVDGRVVARATFLPIESSDNAEESV